MNVWISTSFIISKLHKAWHVLLETPLESLQHFSCNTWMLESTLGLHRYWLLPIGGTSLDRSWVSMAAVPVPSIVINAGRTQWGWCWCRWTAGSIGLEDNSVYRVVHDTTMLVVIRTKQRLIFVVWELVLIRMGRADPAHTLLTKFATQDHRLV